MTKFNHHLLPFFALMVLSSCFQNCHAQVGEWTWMGGDDTINNVTGNYGSMGVSSATNLPPARYAPAFWTDTGGIFWVYGGMYLNNDFLFRNDLWKFDPNTTQQWTWVNGNPASDQASVISAEAGVFSAQNQPLSAGWGVFTWVTPDNHLWMYGGSGGYGGEPNGELWQYDPAINEWAWMNTSEFPAYGTQGVPGPQNSPGPRYESNSAWTDKSGNLWLFGGTTGGATFNDMWEYDVSANEWTWMSGSDTALSLGSYGTIGVPSVNNYPSARTTNLFWQDEAGNFWLAGGTSFFGVTMYQDIWNFNPQTLEWTWVTGIAGDDESMSGSPCIADTSDKAGPRYENRADWQICEDLMITFSGNNLSTGEARNDMWAYKVSRNEWIEINSWPATGNYGTMGVAGSANYPPVRFGSAGFKDKSNNIWIFGGQYSNGSTIANFYNDLWKYVPDTSCTQSLSCSSRSCNLAPPVITTNKNIFCADDSTQICAPAGYSSYQWNAGVTGTGNCIYAKQAGDYYVNVTDNNGCTAESNHLSISVYPVSSVSILREGDTLSSYGEVDYQWYYNNNPVPNATNPVYIAKEPGSYTLQVTDSNGCTALSQPVNITGINNLQEDAVVMLYPNPCSLASIQLAVGNELVGSELEIYDDEGRLVFQSEISNPKSEITVAGLASGVYFLHISSANTSITKKLVKL